MRLHHRRVIAIAAGILAATAIAVAPASNAGEAAPVDVPEGTTSAPVDASVTGATDLLAPLPMTAGTSAGAMASTEPVVATVDTAAADALRARVLVEARTAQAQALRARIVAVARKQIGDRYRAGATGPNAFDCSGLVRFVFKTAAGMDLAHYSKAQFRSADRVKLTDVQPGDLVFFLRHGAHHVGIYIGDGKMIDAPQPGTRVRVSPIRGDWWGRHYTGIGRVLPA